MENITSTPNNLQENNELPKKINPLNKTKKWPLALMLIILIISTSAIGVLAYQNHLLRQTIQKSITETSYISNLNPTASNSYEEWKIYENKEDGYSFSYPSNWELEVSENEYPDRIYRVAKIIFQNSEIWFYRDPFPQGAPCVENVSEEEILLDGVTANKTIQKQIFGEEVCQETPSSNPDNPLKHIMIDTIKDDMPYLIIATYELQNETSFEPTFNQVISSFKFLN